MAGAANKPGGKTSDRETQAIQRRLQELEERLGSVRGRRKPEATGSPDGRSGSRPSSLPGWP